MKFKEYLVEYKIFQHILMEGGAMEGVGAIHIDEIEPTLIKIQNSLIRELGQETFNRYFDGGSLLDNALGSVQKKLFSGDMDIAINIDRSEIPEFVSVLQRIPEVKEVKTGSVIMMSVEIDGKSDVEPPEGKARTGLVQIDFMPGEKQWMKTFYHSPNLLKGESKYGGIYRTLLLTAITSNVDTKVGEIDPNDPMERPEFIERYKWGSNGVVRVRRTPGKNAKGYLKKNDDEVIAGPYTNPQEIVKVLNLGSTENLNSYESLRKTIEERYEPELVTKILESYKKLLENQGLEIPGDL